MDAVNNIILGFDNWGDRYDWWTPNTCPPNLTVDGLAVLPVTYGWLWFRERPSDFSTDVNQVENLQPTKVELLMNYLNVCFAHLCDLKDCKYIYPVFIQNPSYFLSHETIGFDYVSKQVLDDVKAGRAKIVIAMPFEGFINLPNNRDIGILNSWCSIADLKADQVYYIHAELNTSLLPADLNFTYVPIHAFHCWLPPPPTTISNYKPVDDKNLFLAYGRNGHDHRLIFMCELIKSQLLNRGLVSYHGGSYRDPSDLRIEKRLSRPDLVEYATILDTLRPLTIDQDLSNSNPTTPFAEHYDMTFMSVVLETQSNNDTLFFSEKIWKPIWAGQPFMLVAGLGYLEELKRLGYKTFDKWFDESYDQMFNLGDRISCVISELERLSKLSIAELTAMREDMKEVLEHNQRRFAEQYHKEYNSDHNHYLYKEFKKIWESF